MAKRKPKLGDVRYRKNKVSVGIYFVYVYYKSAWRLRDVQRGRKDASRSAKTWRTFMKDIIREARQTRDGRWETDRCRDEPEAREVKKNREKVFASIIREARETGVKP